MKTRFALSIFFTVGLAVTAALGVFAGDPVVPCASEKRELLRRLEGGYRSVLDGKSSPEAFRDARAYLASFAGGACGLELKKVYGLASLDLMHPGRASDNLRFAGLLRLAVDLSLADRIRPIEESPYAGESGYVGAYSCDGVRIYLDFSLDVYDLGAVFYHELSHYFRDRLSKDRGLGAVFAPRERIESERFFYPKDPVLPPLSREDVLADETFSVLEGAWAQVRLAYDSGRLDPSHLYPVRPVYSFDHFPAAKKKARRMLGLFNDFTFSREKGPLYRLMSDRIENDAQGMPLWASLSELLPKNARELERQLPELSEIIASVADVYFPGQSVEIASVVGKISTELGSKYGTMTDFDRALFGDVDFVGQPSEYGSFSERWKRFLEPRKTLRPNDADWESWVKDLSVPSPRCKAELEFERKHPNKEGTRPNKEGTRPCLQPKSKL